MAIALLTIFINLFSFGNVFAAENSFFNENPFNWVKAQIGNIFPGDADGEDSQSDNSQDFIVLQNSYVVKTSSPAASDTSSDQKRDFVINYEVKNGDTLAKISNDYGISLNTLIWANGLNVKSILKEGQELKILPIDGVLYVVKKGDNLSVVAKKYKAEVNDIIDFNDLPADGAIKEGMDLILPNAILPSSSASTSTSSKSTAKSGSVSQKIASAASSAKQKLSALYAEAEKFFIIPVSGRITQGKHSYTPPAVDIGNACGTPVFASADGTVTVVRQTTSRSRSAEGGYGNNIRIQHSNSALTLYSHLLYGSLLVGEGDYVKQGQKIAEIGGGKDKKGRMMGAGRSTGCHLHYEVRNGTNFLVNTAKYRKGMVIETPAARLAIDDSNVGAGDAHDNDDDNNGTGFTGVISEPYKGN